MIIFPNRSSIYVFVSFELMPLVSKQLLDGKTLVLEVM
jgi:hypothetical protein